MFSHDFGLHDSMEEDDRQPSISEVPQFPPRPKFLVEERLGMDWELEHIFFSDKVFKKSKKGDITQALEDVVEAYLGDLFQHRAVVYPSDVAAGLDLDYNVVQKLFVKFVRKGKLKE